MLKIDLTDADIAKIMDDLINRSFIEKDEDLDMYEYKQPEVDWSFIWEENLIKYFLIVNIDK